MEELGKVDGHEGRDGWRPQVSTAVHSLTKLLVNYDVEFVFVSRYITHAGRRAGCGPWQWAPLQRQEDAHGVIEDADVLYVGACKERFSDAAEYDRMKDQYVVDELMARAKADDCQPAARVNEISYAVDTIAGCLFPANAQQHISVWRCWQRC